MIVPLNSLEVGEKCIVLELVSEGLIRRRLLDLGLIPATIVEAVQESPFGDPVAYLIRGTVIALRSEVAESILVEKI